ncbi:MAG: DUF4388 domain-containing protein [Planctomycetes bacterium]|nr:DUF4388 domain-containing protein [Planctomycetota bacterium]
MSVTGNTPYLGLFELMQLLELHRRDLCVFLRTRDTGGYLHFQEGALTDSRLGIAVGEEAFLRLAGWVESECVIEPAGPPRERTVTRATADLLFLAMRAAPACRPATAPAWSVRGDIPTLSLVELVQLFEMNGRPCRIDVQAGAEGKGALHMEGGRLLHAGADAAAEDALYDLLALDEGSYQVTAGATAPIGAQELPASSIILEAMRRADERRLAAAAREVERQARVVALLADLDAGKLSVETRTAIARRYLPGGETTAVPVLLRLAADPSVEVRAAALSTLRELPQDVLLGLVADPAVTLDVLAALLRAFPDDPELQEGALEHPALTERLAAEIAARADAQTAAAVAASRFAADPTVRAALDANPHAREPRPEDGHPGGRGGRRARRRALSSLPLPDRLYLALTGTPKQQLSLAASPFAQIATAVIGSPRMNEGLIETIAGMPTANSDALRDISRTRRWSNQRAIARNLAFNPKTPIGCAVDLLARLGENDLKSLARNLGVTDQVRQAANRRLQMLETRRGGAG